MGTKTVQKTIRLTENAARTMDAICTVGNNYNLKINGDGELNCNVVLSTWIERIAKNREGRTQMMFDAFVQVLNIKDATGKELSPQMTREVAREVIEVLNNGHF